MALTQDGTDPPAGAYAVWVSSTPARLSSCRGTSGGARAAPILCDFHAPGSMRAQLIQRSVDSARQKHRHFADHQLRVVAAILPRLAA